MGCRHLSRSLTPIDCHVVLRWSVRHSPASRLSEIEPSPPPCPFTLLATSLDPFHHPSLAMPHAAVIAGCVIAGLATAYAVHTTIIQPIHEQGWEEYSKGHGGNAQERWSNFCGAWGHRAHHLKRAMNGRSGEGSDPDGEEQVALREIEEFERERKRQEDEQRSGEGNSTAVGNGDRHDSLRKRQPRGQHALSPSQPPLRNPFDDLTSSPSSPHHHLGFDDEDQISTTLSPPHSNDMVLFDAGSHQSASRPVSPGVVSDGGFSSTAWSDAGARSATSDEWERLDDEESDDEGERGR
ncbi:hypothetical protein BDZ90DRAFT_123926 [Jaminaea rosea]|uniref:Uncharacterized protein n=1 Tax=Jaminaea rosea TaxID=1569628 RepID=A0A316UGH0_9BASI|nr:hypothetical protein BDZ90DRAFT_123926 [Jaminaea rosea]PWN24427.1 hypothetical protein BDZ90DRAFT_123926 [Jaminaea rosea]